MTARTVQFLTSLLFAALGNLRISNAFHVSRCHFQTQRRFITTLRKSSSNPIDESSDEIERQKQALSTTLNELDGLKSSISEAPDRESLESLQQALDHVESKVSDQVSAILPPPGLSLADFAAALRMYGKLPLRSRVAFCKALKVDNPVDAALDFERIPEIVTLLYTERPTPMALEAAMKSTDRLVIRERQDAASASMKEFSSTDKEEKPKQGLFGYVGSNLAEEVSDEEKQFINLVEQTFSRTTRKEGRVATEKDLQTLLDILNRETFVVSGKEEIPGGYIIRGTPNSKLEADDLLQAIDDRLPPQWPCEVLCMEDFTASARGEFDQTESPTLVLLKKDMSPEPRPLLRTLSNLAAMTTAFLFSVGVYGGNKLAMARLEEQSPTGDYVGFAWFTEKTFEVLLPILAIQVVHELGHWAIARRDGLKTTTPTLLPGWGLPFLGCQNNFVESPKNLTSLFDYAMLGPLLGLLASLGFLVSGLELTNAAGPETLKYLPALPVDVLRSSTLGGSLVDSFLGGGQGFVTLQDPKMPVPLHPFAIAGFTGLLSNALALLPIGSTDGGRMSVTIFSRPGQLLVGSVVWLFLLIASFTFERADALIGAWAVYNIVQNDLEIPCRDEITEVDAVRAVVGFGLWFVAILAIVPMQ